MPLITESSKCRVPCFTKEILAIFSFPTMINLSYSDHCQETCVITAHHAFCVICCYGDLLVVRGRSHGRAICASTLIGELQPQFVHLLHVSHCRGEKEWEEEETTSFTSNTVCLRRTTISASGVEWGRHSKNQFTMVMDKRRHTEQKPWLEIE